MNDRVLVLRDAVVKITQMLSGKGIRVTQRGVNAYVKCDHQGRPILVNLPYLPDNATDELCFAIQGFLDHEVAHILFTEFALLAVATKEGCMSMLNILEDARIEKAMGEKFAGCASNLAVTGKFFLDKYTTPMMNEAITAGDANKLVGVLMVPLIRSMAGQYVFKEFMSDKMTHIKPVFDKIADLQSKIEGATSTKDCLALAKEIGKRLRDDKPKSKPDDGEGEGEGEGEGDSDGMPGGKSSKGAKPKPGAKKAPKKAAPKSEEDDEEKDDAGAPKPDDKGEEKKGKAKAKAKDDEKDGEDEDGEDEAAGSAKSEDDDEEKPEDEGDEDEGDEDEGEDGGASDDAELGDDSDEDSESETGNTSAFMDAIDKENANGFEQKMSSMISKEATDAAKVADYLVFTKDDDVIEPLKVGSGYTPSMFKDLADKVDHMVGPLQKDLERAIAARSLSNWEAGRRSGRIAPANLSRLAVGDTRVFRRKHEANSKDVAVSLVVDASGSMAGSKIHLATQAAYALSQVLERIGIKHEVICFTTGPGESSTEAAEEARKLGRSFSRSESLYMPILKGFDERLTTPVRDRFGWLPNSRILRNNVDGECIEIAARRLKQRREAGKVMMVLSDGAPNAYGDRGGLDVHLKDVVKNVSKAGVNIVGIGVMTNCVQRYYPKNLVINNVEELPDRVIKELRHLLVS